GAVEADGHVDREEARDTRDRTELEYRAEAGGTEPSMMSVWHPETVEWLKNKRARPSALATSLAWGRRPRLHIEHLWHGRETDRATPTPAASNPADSPLFP